MNFPLITNLKLVGVADRGTNKERVIIRIMNDCNLARYAIVHAIRSPGGGVSSTNRLLYWFADVEVEEGAFVVLYTRSGIDGLRYTIQGDALHVFHWNQQSSVWIPGNTPTLIYMKAIQYKDV